MDKRSTMLKDYHIKNKQLFNERVRKFLDRGLKVLSSLYQKKFALRNNYRNVAALRFFGFYQEIKPY